MALTRTYHKIYKSLGHSDPSNPAHQHTNTTPQQLKTQTSHPHEPTTAGEPNVTGHL